MDIIKNGLKKLFLAYPSLILALAGVGLWIFVYLIYWVLPLEQARWVWFFAVAVLIYNGIILGRFVETLAIKGYTDALTGLPNKGFMYLRLNIDIEKYARRQKEYSLAMIDIDRFKIINDTYGHLAGDKVIKEVANIISHSVRASDSVIRWGGEEFAVLIPETSEEGAASLVDRIRTVIEAHDFGPAVESHQVTISAGVVSFKNLQEVRRREKHLTNPTDLIVNFSDRALYQAKQTRNTVCCFNQGIIT
ncbi:diguanylate cyclase (GGDEF) domain-containing protein [Desulfitobacterium dichloroeliminans LMG P-21439]|uniref:Diguanylate cyclase (GGDEF) domain-containing protein n=1 Tax=Desulfitobacterium dichloroeliminans (strain LMG P-21439 / DCA1) TaxID=871963 RepID=L0FCK9_DESDL|nr:GGDEF domain-containing protein [Desulfitobacterium dichloroeliminans]AGA70678.1 diguanylate cyclase (GGDEF) domain-containing protein [Desulfitobacterium dichloroeliminans LMG P-21439]